MTHNNLKLFRAFPPDIVGLFTKDTDVTLFRYGQLDDNMLPSAHLKFWPELCRQIFHKIFPEMPHTSLLDCIREDLRSCQGHRCVSILDEHARLPTPLLFELLQHPLERRRLRVGREGLEDDAGVVLPVDDHPEPHWKTVLVLHGRVIVQEHGAVPNRKGYLRTNRINLGRQERRLERSANGYGFLNQTGITLREGRVKGDGGRRTRQNTLAMRILLLQLLADIAATAAGCCC